ERTDYLARGVKEGWLGGRVRAAGQPAGGRRAGADARPGGQGVRYRRADDGPCQAKRADPVRSDLRPRPGALPELSVSRLKMAEWCPPLAPRLAHPTLSAPGLVLRLPIRPGRAADARLTLQL